MSDLAILSDAELDAVSGGFVLIIKGGDGGAGGGASNGATIGSGNTGGGFLSGTVNIVKWSDLSVNGSFAVGGAGGNGGAGVSVHI
jgi:hypothetical protein